MAKKRNNFMLSNDAQAIIDSIERSKKSEFVSKAIVKAGCEHIWSPADMNGQFINTGNYPGQLQAKCIKCGLVGGDNPYI